MFLRQISDPHLTRHAYLIGCPETRQALVIDPPRDIGPICQIAAENGFRIRAVAETHIHSDFVSGARELAVRLGAEPYFSGMDASPACLWAEKHALSHGEIFQIGNLAIRAIHTPGHTPEHLSLLIYPGSEKTNDPFALATGDWLYPGDTGRPENRTRTGIRSARTLARSLRENLPSLPDHVLILPTHDGPVPHHVGNLPFSTLGHERRTNPLLRLALENEDAFANEILQSLPEIGPQASRLRRMNQTGPPLSMPHMPPRVRPDHALAFSRQLNSAILDTRPGPAQFASGHLPKSIHAPFASGSFLMAAEFYVDEDQEILIVAQNETDARKAVTQLHSIGLDRIGGWAVYLDIEASGAHQHKMKRILFRDWLSAAPHKGIALDVRPTIHFARSHLPNAVSIPGEQLRKRLEELPKDKKIHVHCTTGHRAAAAASFLRSKGFDAVLIDGEPPAEISAGRTP